MKHTDDVIYSTTDLALATALSIHLPMEGIDKSIPQKTIFLFKRTETLENLLESYWRGLLRIEPQSFFNQLRNLKTRIYEND